MDDPLDRLLTTPLLAPPADFARRVMMQIDATPVPRKLRRWPWLALIGGVLGAAQLLAFAFGIWTAASAG